MNASPRPSRPAVAAALVLALCYAPAASIHAAQSASPNGRYTSLDALPDWRGTWFLDFAPPDKSQGLPRLKGQYLEAYRRWAQQVKSTDGEVARADSNCTPPGMPVIMAVPQYPIEFLFTPGRVTIHSEAWMQWRNIFTDRRTHPADLDPTFQGDSVGHWQGDTLIVETVGTKEDLGLTLMTRGSVPAHGPKLRILERMHLDPKNQDTLIDEMTLEDPDALEAPWTQRLIYRRSRDQQLLEFECAENDRNPVDASGKTTYSHE
jgi:hypothetical protein